MLLKRGRWLLLLLAATLSLAGMAVSAASFTATSANPGVAFTAGILAHSNSRSGAAILTASGLRPGESRQGTVRITNTGDVDGDFFTSLSELVDAPGPNGGKLSDVLRLTVYDQFAGVTLYNGLLKDMPTLDWGTWSPTESHQYTFTVTFPDGGSAGGDNAYQGSRTSVRVDWLSRSDLQSADYLHAYSQETDPDGLLGYQVRAGSVPTTPAAVRLDDTMSINLGGVTSTTATWMNRVLTVKTPATFPAGVSQVTVIAYAMADPANPGRQPLTQVAITAVGTNGTGPNSVTMGPGQKRQINVSVRMNAAWPAGVQIRPALVVGVKNASLAYPYYGYTVPVKVYYGSGPGPD
jgi:hypothetical protein